jgi:hypothetical protein
MYATFPAGIYENLMNTLRFEVLTAVLWDVLLGLWLLAFWRTVVPEPSRV